MSGVTDRLVTPDSRFIWPAMTTSLSSAMAFSWSAPSPAVPGRMGLYADHLDETAEPPCLVQVVGSQAQLSLQDLDEWRERPAHRRANPARHRINERAKPGEIGRVVE